MFFQSVLIAGGAHAAALEVNRVEPGEDPIYGVQKLYVEPFGGTWGDDLAHRVRNAFQVTERGSTRSTVPFLQEGLRVDAYTLVTEPSEADGVMRGSTMYRHDYRHTYGKKPCTELKVVVTTRWSIVSTEGAVLGKGADESKDSVRRCGSDRNSYLPSPDELAHRVIARKSLGDAIGDVFSKGQEDPIGHVASSIVEPMMPRWDVHREGLRKNGDNKDVVKLADSGDWEQAVCIWRNSSSSDDLYNLGVLYEMKGWYPQAEAAYQRVIEAGEDKAGEKGLERVRARMNAVQAMADGYSMPFEQLAPPENDICRAYE